MKQYVLVIGRTHENRPAVSHVAEEGFDFNKTVDMLLAFDIEPLDVMHVEFPNTEGGMQLQLHFNRLAGWLDTHVRTAISAYTRITPPTTPHVASDLWLILSRDEHNRVGALYTTNPVTSRMDAEMELEDNQNLVSFMPVTFPDDDTGRLLKRLFNPTKDPITMYQWFTKNHIAEAIARYLSSFAASEWAKQKPKH